MNWWTLSCKTNDLSTNSCDSIAEIIKSLSHDFTIVSKRDSDVCKACDKPTAIKISTCNIKYR